MGIDSLLLSKLRRPRVWQRLFRERLTQPLHINLLSLVTLLFGSFRSRVEHDLVVRPHNAFAILRAADYALQEGLRAVTLVEFGVATGAGLMNMAKIAERVTRITGVEFRIVGFDTGAGMPPPVDYRDHPDLYGTGDFAMDFDRLRRVLPASVRLVIGNVQETVPEFLASLPEDAPIGYVVYDLDYYSSTKAAMALLTAAQPERYLPITLAYFDDILMERHNSWCGELLAIDEFNTENRYRKIERSITLMSSRIYQRAQWIPQMYFVHTLDHPSRLQGKRAGRRALANPYL